MRLTAWAHKKFIDDLNHFNKISDTALIIQQNKNKKALILIPLNGCGTCTKEIIEFSKKNFNNNKFLEI